MGQAESVPFLFTGGFIMKRLCGVLLVLASAALASGADDKKDNAANEELRKFEGTWALVSLEIDGKPAERPFDKVVIKDDKATFSLGDKVIVEVTFSVDPTKNPKTMDATTTSGPDKGKKTFCIYELDGDNLKVCMPEGEQRPKELSAKEGSKCSLFVWKRMKN
jgi:uncharacterized protein (TIGR03067 family)